MNNPAVSTDEIPTTWPRKLYPPPATYHFDHARIVGAKIREQGLARYRRDPEKWIKAVRKWQDANSERVRAYNQWWYLQNRERRLIEMRAYTKAWRATKKTLVSVPG